jgi:hypothetical protein
MLSGWLVNSIETEQCSVCKHARKKNPCQFYKELKRASADKGAGGWVVPYPDNFFRQEIDSGYCRFLEVKN